MPPRMPTTLRSTMLLRPNWPPEVRAAILRGDSRLKAIRRWRDETQVHLTSTTGIGQGYLSDLENGRRTGTPEAIAKLAQALDVPVAWHS